MASQNSINAGIFANENGQRFLHILIVIAERGFGELYQNSKGDVQGKYYQRGLLHVQNWNDDMMEEDARVMSKKFPDLVESFEGCFMDYIMSKYRGQRPTVTLPSIFLFLRRFYEAVAEHDSLKTGDYFTKRDPIVQRITCMDACRQTFFALSTAETVRVELASEAGSTAPYRRATTSTPTPSVLSQAKRRELEESVHPDDSASNVGGPAPAAARAAPPAELTPVKQEEEEVAPAAPSPPPSVVEKKAAPPDDDVRSHVSAAPSKRDASSTVSRASPPPPPNRGTSELSSTRPHQPSSAKPPPPKPPASDVASRHDFVMSDEEDGELVPSPMNPIPQLERPRGSSASAVGSALDWERKSALVAPPRQRATVGVARAHSPQHHR